MHHAERRLSSAFSRRTHWSDLRVLALSFPHSIWPFLIANELVDVLVLFGDILGVSDGLLVSLNDCIASDHTLPTLIFA